MNSIVVIYLPGLVVIVGFVFAVAFAVGSFITIWAVNKWGMML